VATISQDTTSAYIASQSNGSQIKFEDINHIDEDDIEEMDIKWNMELLSMRADKFWKRTGKKISIQGSYDWIYMANEEDHALVADGEALIEFALMANIENKEITCSCFHGFIDKDLINLVIPDVRRPSPTVVSTSAEGQNKDSSTSEDVASPNPPKPFVKFVKPKDIQPESKSKEQETPKKSQVKYAEQYRHSNKRPKGNQRNWNNLKSYQLGPEFVLHKKLCFNCGDFSHLANDCRRRVQRETTRSQNHPYNSSLHRSGGHRPYGAPMRPPLRSYGHRPHGGSMRPLHRSADQRSHGPSINPRRPTMNGARPYKSFFIQSPSYETRPFLKSSIVKTPYRAPWVPTINRYDPPVNRKFSTGRRNFPTANRKFPTASKKFTTGSIKNDTADVGRKGKAVKPSAC
nr:ribonuclease H-like domain-containing protein [Tanacetum cinerariifolium]